MLRNERRGWNRRDSLAVCFASFSRGEKSSANNAVPCGNGVLSQRAMVSW